MIVQYSICKLNWQNFTFWNWTHSLIPFKPERLTWQRLCWHSAAFYPGRVSFGQATRCHLNWQGLSQTTHLLSSILAEIIPDKPLLAWRNPARTNQFLETLNWHGIWYRPRITTCPLLITAWSERNAQCHSNDLTSASVRRQKRKVSTELRSKWDVFYTQILGNSPLFQVFWLVTNYINYVIVLS